MEAPGGEIQRIELCIEPDTCWMRTTGIGKAERVVLQCYGIGLLVHGLQKDGQCCRRVEGSAIDSGVFGLWVRIRHECFVLDLAQLDNTG